jgi:hypothetical protein
MCEQGLRGDGLQIIGLVVLHAPTLPTVTDPVWRARVLRGSPSGLPQIEPIIPVLSTI